MIFRCEIEMDNDAMRTSRDLAQALKVVIKQIEFYSAGILEVKLNIRDINGNAVGGWEITEE